MLPDPTRSLQEQPLTVLLAMLLFGEARNQAQDAMLGVGNAVRNRVHAPRNETGRRFGLGWAGVILRPGAFDCFREADPNYRKLLEPLKYEAPAVWERCCTVAAAILGDGRPDNTRGATHYHDKSVLPWWAKPQVIQAGRMTPTIRIGDFLFYREP